MAAVLVLAATWGAPKAWASPSDTFLQNWLTGSVACQAKPGSAPPAPGAGVTGGDVMNALIFGCQEGTDEARAPGLGIPAPTQAGSLNSELYQKGYESGWYALWFKQGGTVPLPSDPWDFIQGWNTGYGAAIAAEKTQKTGGGQIPIGSTGVGGTAGQGQLGKFVEPALPYHVEAVYPASGPASGGNTVMVVLAGEPGTATAVYFGTQKATGLSLTDSYLVPQVLSHEFGGGRLLVTAPAGKPGTTVSVWVRSGTTQSNFSLAGSYTYGSGSFTVGAEYNQDTMSAISGTAPKGAKLTAYLFCSGGCPSGQSAPAATDLCSERCTAEPLGQATVDGDITSPALGAYRIPVTLPKTALGVDSIVVGCDSCKTGWISLNDLYQQPSLTYNEPVSLPKGTAPEPISITSIAPESVPVTGESTLVIRGHGLSQVWELTFVTPHLDPAPVPPGDDGIASGPFNFRECAPGYCGASGYGFRVISDQEIVAVVPPAMYAQPAYANACSGREPPGPFPDCANLQLAFAAMQPPIDGYVGLHAIGGPGRVAPQATIPGDPEVDQLYDAVAHFTYDLTSARPPLRVGDTGRPMTLVQAHFTGDALPQPGGTVTVEGSGPPNVAFQTALFCSGGCGGASIGPVITDGSGQFQKTFTLPGSVTPDGPLTLEIGCNGTGPAVLPFACNGWTGVTSLQSPPPQPVVTGLVPSSGSDAGGNQVTVTGQHLDGALQVTFGAAGPGSDVQASSDGTSLTVTAPASAQDGPVDVQVTSAGGESAAVSADQYTYQAVPGEAPGTGTTAQPSGPPQVDAISPGSGPDGGGQRVILRGANLTGATGVQFGLYGRGTNLSVSPDGSTLVVTTPEDWWGDGPAWVQVITPKGTSKVLPADRYTYVPGAPVSSGSPSVSSPSAPTSPTGGGTSTGSQGGETSVAPVTSGAPGVAVVTVTRISPSSGPDTGGQTVTLTGSGLQGATQVEFGSFGHGTDNVEADHGTEVAQGTDLHVSADGTSLTVTTPQAWWGDGPVYVRVTTGHGSVTIDGRYTYEPVSPSSSSTSTPTGGGTSSGSQGGQTRAAPVTSGTSNIPVVTGISPSLGPEGGGQKVTLTGSGFQGATDVQFGPFGHGTAFSVSPDGTSLTVTTPEAWWGVGPVYVGVTTPTGDSKVLPEDQYTFQAGGQAPGSSSSAAGAGPGGLQGSPATPPTPAAVGAPVVTGISPDSGPDRGGQRVTITGTDLTGATDVQFGRFGRGTAIQVSPDGTSLTVTTPEAWWGDSRVYVQVTTPKGQSAATDATLYTYGSAPAPSNQGSGTTSTPSSPGGGSGSAYTQKVDCSSPNVSFFDKQVAGCPGF